MEKLIAKAIVILGLTFSHHAMSGTYSACAGSTCNNGTFNSGNASSGNLGAFSPGFVLGSGMGGGPSAADMAKKKAAEEEAKKQRCSHKTKALGEAEGKRDTCEYDAQIKFNTAADACPTVTKATIQIDVSRGVNVGVDAALKKFGVNAGAVAGFVVSGTLEYSPQASCRLNLDDIKKGDDLKCRNDFNATQRAFADCP